jgi:hypothetical protein
MRKVVERAYASRQSNSKEEKMPSRRLLDLVAILPAWFVAVVASPASAQLTITVSETYVGTYNYGADCANYTGQETLVLSGSSAAITGTVSDVVKSPVAGADHGTVSGSVSGSAITLHSSYVSGLAGTLTGTFSGGTISGKITGICGSGATVTLSATGFLTVTAIGTLPAATSGQSYTYALPATGPFGANVWAASGLPPGFSIPNDAIVSSGSPAAATGPYSVILAVAEAGLGGTVTIPLNVVSGNNSLSITSVNSPSTYLYIGPPPYPIGPSPAFPEPVTNEFNATVILSNTGQDLSSPDTLSVYLAAPGQADLPMGSQSTGSLAVNGVSTTSIPVSIPSGTPAGRYYLKACVSSGCKTSATKTLVIDFASAVQNGVYQPSISGGNISWTFLPNFAGGVPPLSIKQAAELGGFDHFNWYQSIVAGLSLGTDPALGGNLLQRLACFPRPGADYFQWYLNEVLLGCSEADKLYIGNLLGTGLTFTDNPDLRIPSFYADFETYLAGVNADLTGVVIRGIPGVNVSWRYTQLIPSPAITASVGAQAAPGPSYGISEFQGYINDFTPERVRGLKLDGVLPEDASLTVLPATGPQGGSLDISIVGNGTHFVEGVSLLSFNGTGLTVNSLTVTSPTTASANITIAKDAPAFSRDVYVATSDEVAAAARAFAVTPTVTLFSTFFSAAETSATGFELVSTFTLGSGSKGINPPAQEVVLALGSYSVTIPANSFHLTPAGNYAYEGTINGVRVEAQIVRSTTVPNSYTLTVEGNTPVNLSSPVAELTIGYDMGIGAVKLDN